MTPEEKKLYALMAVAEEQQHAINQAIQNLNLTQAHIQQVIAEQTQASVSAAVNDGLKQGNEQMLGTAKQLNQLNQSIRNNLKQLSWQFIALYAIGVFSVLIALSVVVAVMMPSLDEIQKRRADLKELNEYPLQVTKSDGKVLVKIMTKKCYSFQKKPTAYDWCEIDPKKY